MGPMEAVYLLRASVETKRCDWCKVKSVAPACVPDSLYPPHSWLGCRIARPPLTLCSVGERPPSCNTNENAELDLVALRWWLWMLWELCQAILQSKLCVWRQRNSEYGFFGNETMSLVSVGERTIDANHKEIVAFSKVLKCFQKCKSRLHRMFSLFSVVVLGARRNGTELCSHLFLFSRHTASLKQCLYPFRRSHPTLYFWEDR